jgi:hypothetical protein
VGREVGLHDGERHRISGMPVAQQMGGVGIRAVIGSQQLGDPLIGRHGIPP